MYCLKNSRVSDLTQDHFTLYFDISIGLNSSTPLFTVTRIVSSSQKSLTRYTKVTNSPQIVNDHCLPDRWCENYSARPGRFKTVDSLYVCVFFFVETNNVYTKYSTSSI